MNSHRLMSDLCQIVGRNFLAIRPCSRKSGSTDRTARLEMGFPDESTTGVPPGVSGGITIDTAWVVVT
jgi:hypothetical protein